MDVTDITVRKMGKAFNFEELEDALVFKGFPEESYAVIGGSFLLPGLEPYLIRSMKATLKQVTDEMLIEDIKLFNAQEAQHFRQHQRLNDVIKDRGFPGLVKLEEEIKADFYRLTETKSLRFNLAYAAAFEAVTTIIASLTFDLDTAADYEPSVRQLVEWHMAEEVEHRFVAWDAYHHLFGDVAGKLFLRPMVVYQLWHSFKWSNKVARWMLRADPLYPEGYGGKRRIRERKKTGKYRNLVMTALPRALNIFLPGYTPHKFNVKSAEKVIAAGKLYAEIAAAQSR